MPWDGFRRRGKGAQSRVLLLTQHEPERVPRSGRGLDLEKASQCRLPSPRSYHRDGLGVFIGPLMVLDHCLHCDAARLTWRCTRRCSRMAGSTRRPWPNPTIATVAADWAWSISFSAISASGGHPEESCCMQGLRRYLVLLSMPLRASSGASKVNRGTMESRTPP